MTRESSEISTQFDAMPDDRPNDDQSTDLLKEDSKSPAVIEKFVIRLPNGLRDRIRQLSEQNRRSMNSEIIMVLESHIRQQFMQHMAEANPDGGDFAPGQRKTEAELNKMLESLPAQKKEALLELLG